MPAMSKRDRERHRGAALHRRHRRPERSRASLAAEAHHSIAAVYDSTRQQRLEGVVAEFQFVNPHPFVIVTVDAEGAASRGGSRWTIVSSSPTSA